MLIDILHLHWWLFLQNMLIWIKKCYKMQCILLNLVNIYTCTGKIPGTYIHVSLMVISERLVMERVFFTGMLKRHKQDLLSVQYHTCSYTNSVFLLLCWDPLLSHRMRRDSGITGSSDMKRFTPRNSPVCPTWAMPRSSSHS